MAENSLDRVTRHQKGNLQECAEKFQQHLRANSSCGVPFLLVVIYIAEWKIAHFLSCTIDSFTPIRELLMVHYMTTIYSRSKLQSHSVMV